MSNPIVAAIILNVASAFDLPPRDVAAIVAESIEQVRNADVQLAREMHPSTAPHPRRDARHLQVVR
jgi:hypothetical protein